MGGNEWASAGANSSDAAIQLGFPAGFFLLVFWVWWQFLKNLISQVMTSLSSPNQSAFNLWDTRWQLTIGYSANNLLSSPFIHACIQIEKFRDTQRRTNRITHSLPPSYTDTLIYHFIPKRLYTFKQTEETVIVRMQLSCTVHLLDCCGTKGPLLMRLAACE